MLIAMLCFSRKSCSIRKIAVGFSRMNPDQTRELSRKARRIQGWFEAAGLFGLIDDVQHREGVAGDLFEIGVHHGKSAVVLGNMARTGEALGVCDIFGSQSGNASGSGSGDRAIFERNMHVFAPECRVRVFECLSSSLTTDQIGEARFFHVDGGHLTEEARSDLELAAAVVVDGGVIVVDDPFRPEWPGVTEAILQFVADHPDSATVALGFNKLVLARREHADMYRGAVLSDAAWTYVDSRVWARKVLPVAGADAPIFYVPTYRQISGMEAKVAQSRWVLAAVKRRLGG